MIGKTLVFVVSFIFLVIAALIGMIVVENQVFYEQANLISSQDSNSYKINIENTLKVVKSDGTLGVVGWSNSLKNVAVDSTLLNKYRFKKWEVFLFRTDKYFGMVSLFNLSYLGGFLIHYVDIYTGKVKAVQHIDIFNLPKIDENCRSHCTLAEYKNDKVNMNANFSQTEPGVFFVSLKYSNLDIDLNFDLRLYGKDYDSIATITSINEDKSKFYVNDKKYSLASTGSMTIDKQNIELSLAKFTHDSGRGVWPIKSGWVWITGTGKTNNGEDFGINVGHGFSNPNLKFTEDSFFVNGKLYKISLQKYSKAESLNEKGYHNYKFHKSSEPNSNTCDLLFKTVAVKDDIIKIPFTRNNFEINYGVFEGTCYDLLGNSYEVNNIFGFVERKFSLW